MTVTAWVRGGVLLAALLCLSGFRAIDGRITVVRVQGNQRLSDDEILRMAGIELGDPFDGADPGAALAIEERLVRSGKFESVDIRVRTRSLEPTEDVALVIVVRERPTLGSRFMVAPIFALSDEYGVTFGATPAAVDLAVEGARLALPLSWGGTRKAALETRFPAASLRLDVQRFRQVNPHFELPDDRLAIGGGAGARRGLLNVDVGGRWTEVDFGGVDERFASLEAGLALDSRRDAAIPGNAFYLGVDGRRLFFTEAAGRADVSQYQFDLRGYKRLFGQTVLAVQARYQLSDGELPPYERPFLGGGRTLRGFEPGRFLGDNAALGSVELRVPLTSPSSISRAGVHAFYDTGAAHDHGTSLFSARFHDSAGVGAFFQLAVIGVRVDLGFDLAGGRRFHVASGMKF